MRKGTSSLLVNGIAHTFEYTIADNPDRTKDIEINMPTLIHDNGLCVGIFGFTYTNSVNIVTKFPLELPIDFRLEASLYQHSIATEISHDLIGKGILSFR